MAPSTGCGPVLDPKLYETGTRDLLLVAGDSYGLAPTHRKFAVRFDVVAGRFDPAVTVHEGPTMCFDSARLGQGRIYVVMTLGRAGQPSEGVRLSFSDDDGRTWSQLRPIPILMPTALCPSLAASYDELYLMWGREDAIQFARAGAASVCPAPGQR
jgi:hypothetical protein